MRMLREKMGITSRLDSVENNKHCKCFFDENPERTQNLTTYYKYVLGGLATQVLKMIPGTFIPAYYQTIDVYPS